MVSRVRSQTENSLTVYRTCCMFCNDRIYGKTREVFMKTTFGDLWRSEGTIGRGAYALVGLLGFALKHNLDRLVATYGFHRPWGLFNYWVPVRDVARITQLRGSEAVFLGTMVALSLPFIWVGVVLTMKRLRSAGLPTHLGAVFSSLSESAVFLDSLCI